VRAKPKKLGLQKNNSGVLREGEVCTKIDLEREEIKKIILKERDEE